MQPDKIFFSKQNLAFLSLCLAGLALIVLLGVLPLYRQNVRLELEIPKLQTALQEQQRLSSMLEAIDKKIERTHLDPRFPAVTPAPLEQSKTHLVIPEIKKIAAKTKITIRTIEPLITNRKNDWQSLTIRSEMAGQFVDLRPFLLELLTLPYVDTIRSIEIHSAENILNFELIFSVKLV